MHTRSFINNFARAHAFLLVSPWRALTRGTTRLWQRSTSLNYDVFLPQDRISFLRERKYLFFFKLMKKKEVRINRQSCVESLVRLAVNFISLTYFKQYNLTTIWTTINHQQKSVLFQRTIKKCANQRVELR